ncbi:LacI family DNA-binding transcriptional regulator [Yinghuangia seranimata]|uniref:LacI family DNA-binding transcriptional regulator n=1 Tax=Yinghuangia seranimata TaxID=408067 RepID=UPI00248B0961|nr:LacI family DNA-binding transcriptional regulator [Yinghuangia seranimata]MDI2126647.1 LacI family DNA-binding transcriptional regulator [Yinghuangia seranimata]
MPARTKGTPHVSPTGTPADDQAADPRSGRPTSKDVAKLAGVSQSTVSLVHAGKWPGRVSERTVRAVNEASAALGYRPNQAARHLRLGTTRTVLLVVPALTNPFFGAVHTGASHAAAARDFSVVVYPSPVAAGAERTPVASPFAAAHTALDGVLASSTAVETLSDLLGTAGPGAGLPLVMLDSQPGAGAPTANIAIADGMSALTTHLLGLGHRRVARLCAEIDSWTFASREAAFRDAVRAVAGTETDHARTPLTIPDATAAALTLLDGPTPPTALVCDDDVLAVGAYKAARARGLRIPEDLSVTGIGDVAFATVLEPELTTVSLPAHELGEAGMSALLDLLDGRSPDDVSLPAELLLRDSTAPPRA